MHDNAQAAAFNFVHVENAHPELIQQAGLFRLEVSDPDQADVFGS